MKIAAFCALYPPHVIGGAEISAFNLAAHLVRRGHHVHVLSTRIEGTTDHEEMSSISIERVPMPRGYTLFEVDGQPAWKKMLWHAQDHLDPRNRTIWGAFLDRVRPDAALVHIPQGLGFNGLLELARRDIPTVAVLHDLSYVCYKTTMFRDGRTCEKPCLLCGLSARLKAHYLTRIPRLGLVSPSLANLRRVQSFLPVADRPARVILNPNTYPRPEGTPSRPLRPRFLYVGQISRAKGVEFLLMLARELGAEQPMELVIVGAGPALDDLRSRFGDLPWVTFTGKVPLQEVANQMGVADVLCTPSIWPDNSPGVIVHALQLGLPVLGSAVGGIGELVEDDRNGLLLPPEQPDAWRAAMRRVIESPETVARWREGALASASRMAPEQSVDTYESFLNEVAAQPAVSSSPKTGARGAAA